MRAPRITDSATLRTGGRRLQANDSADAHGAGVSRALERLGGQAFALGEEVERRATEADVQHADAEYQRREREILFGRPADPNIPGDEGRQGFLSQRGVDAGANRIRMEEELDAAIAEVAQSRRNRASATAFRDVAARRRASALLSADRHVMGEVQRVEDEARQALALESRNSAVAHYADPAEAAAHINTGANVVREIADAYGDSPEQAAQREKLYRSSAWASIIIRLADDDPSAAHALFEQTRGEMTAEDIGQVRQATQAVMLSDQARQQVDTLLAETGGDFRAAITRAEGIQNTRLRDETIARLLNQGQQRELAESRDADDAEERARAAIAASGPDAVSAGDRALLVREGRWNTLIATGGRGDTQASEALADEILAVSVDDPRRFVALMSVIAGVRSNAEREFAALEAELEAHPNEHTVMNRHATAMYTLQHEDAQFEDQYGFSREELRALRQRLTGDDYRRLREMQEYLLGARPNDQSGQTLIQRTYGDLFSFITPMAERQGIYLRDAPPGMSRRDLNELARSQGAYRGRLMREATDFVRRNNRAPTPAELDQIANSVLTRGRTDGWMGLGREERYAFQSSPNERVTVRYADIPASQRNALDQRWLSENPRARADDANAASQRQRWVERAYADQLQER